MNRVGILLPSVLRDEHWKMTCRGMLNTRISWKSAPESPGDSSWSVAVQGYTLRFENVRSFHFLRSEGATLPKSCAVTIRLRCSYCVLEIHSVELIFPCFSSFYGRFLHAYSSNQAGEHIHGAPIACIGSGTGLGETFLTCPVGGESYT